MKLSVLYENRIAPSIIDKAMFTAIANQHKWARELYDHAILLRKQGKLTKPMPAGFTRDAKWDIDDTWGTLMDMFDPIEVGRDEVVDSLRRTGLWTEINPADHHLFQ